MNKLVFGLPFFAKFLQADINSLKYTIIKRKYNDGKIFMSPGLKVDGIEKYVFDLETGQFIALGERYDSVIKTEKAAVVNTNDGIILRTRQGHSIPYTEREFQRCYCFRVVNPVLYN